MPEYLYRRGFARREYGAFGNFLIVIGTVSENGDSVIIEVSNAELGENRRFKGTVQAFASKILTLVSDEDIAESSEVRVQSDDLLFLGRVLRSVPKHSGTWTVYVSLSQTFAVL